MGKGGHYGAVALHLPFALIMGYLALSILMFWTGPIDWPVINPYELAFYQLGILAAIVFGYFSCRHVRFDNQPYRSLPLSAFYIGTLSIIALQIPVTLTYTDKYPWDVFEALMDQRETYEGMLETIAAGQGERLLVPMMRTLAMPFFYACLAYGVLYFKKLSIAQRLLFIAAALCPVNFSILRGTDKEIADIVILIGGGILVGYYRGRNVEARRGGNPVFTGRRILFAGVLTLLVFLTIFAYRKLERLGGHPEFCLMEGLVCADYSGPVISLLPDFIGFGAAMLDAYMSSGYYGLSLALQQPYDSTLGLGHSGALLNLYQRFTGSTELFESTFIAKISTLGWDHRNYWASLPTWLANDVGFSGALLIIGLMSRWFRQAWFDAVLGRNDFAAVVFILLVVAYIYAPANNQLAQTLESYVAFIIMFCLWKTSRWMRVRRSA